MFHERDGVVDHIRSYLLSVIAAALICSMIYALPGKNGTIGAIRKTLCGIFMSVTLISPLTGLRIPDFQQYLQEFRSDAAQAVLLGQTMSQESAAQLIKDRTAAYILDTEVKIYHKSLTLSNLFSVCSRFSSFTEIFLCSVP